MQKFEDVFYNISFSLFIYFFPFMKVSYRYISRQAKLSSCRPLPLDSEARGSLDIKMKKMSSDVHLLFLKVVFKVAGIRLS